MLSLGASSKERDLGSIGAELVPSAFSSFAPFLKESFPTLMSLSGVKPQPLCYLHMLNQLNFQTHQLDRFSGGLIFFFFPLETQRPTIMHIWYLMAW